MQKQFSAAFFGQLAFFSLSACAIVLAASSYGFGQTNDAPAAEIEDVPPPVIAASAAELQQLKTAADYKQHTQLCLELADTRLQRAEAETGAANYQAVLTDLAGYRALIENGLKFLQSNGDDSKKTRDNFKKMELALRAHTPRLETLRRAAPFEFAVRLKTVLDYAKEARGRALDSFFSDSVLPSNLAAPVSSAAVKKP